MAQNLLLKRFRSLRRRHFLLWALYVFFSLGITACARMVPPENGSLPLYSPEQASPAPEVNRQSLSEHGCRTAGATSFILPAAPKRRQVRTDRFQMRYSPGDRLSVFIPGSTEFSGDIVINADGRFMLPFGVSVPAIGLTNTQLERAIEAALVRNSMFNGSHFQVSVRPVQYAAINVTVAGAVFLPGRFLVGGVKDSDKNEKALAKTGDHPQERFVAAALRAGGGIRPDADLSKVKLVRDGKVHQLDWRGAITGAPVDDIALIDGDHIQVEETSCFQSALVRPSQITPPGIRIFQSNLTLPASSNANSAINQQSQSIPYGARFLAGLVSSNCVGGSLSTNARRYGVLISRNPKTHRTEVIQRSIEELVRSADRDTINPFLMPDDAIVCYDSDATNIKEFTLWLNAFLSPVELTRRF